MEELQNNASIIVNYRQEEWGKEEEVEYVGDKNLETHNPRKWRT